MEQPTTKKRKSFLWSDRCLNKRIPKNGTYPSEPDYGFGLHDYESWALLAGRWLNSSRFEGVLFAYPKPFSDAEDRLIWWAPGILAWSYLRTTQHNRYETQRKALRFIGDRLECIFATKTEEMILFHAHRKKDIPLQFHRIRNPDAPKRAPQAM